MAPSPLGQLGANLMTTTRIIFLGRIFFFFFSPFKVLVLIEIDMLYNNAIFRIDCSS